MLLIALTGVSLATVIGFSVLAWSGTPDHKERTSGNVALTDSTIERGRYLVRIAGCNDCHTPGYAAAGGKVPESDWLIGGKVGFRGPWGTTYPINVRLHLKNMSEQQWLEHARTMKARPPMPWFTLRDMSENDLRALYRFVRYLGPAGEDAPAYLPPGENPKGPYWRQENGRS